jgi:hypothetical protein
VRLWRVLGLLLLIGLVVPRAFAYRTGTGTSVGRITVDTTAQAALAISSTSPQYSVDGQGLASINFRLGPSATLGIRTSRSAGTETLPATQMETRAAFQVTNRSTVRQCVSIVRAGGTTPNNLTGIWGRTPATPPSGGTQLAGAGGTSATNTFALSAGQSMVVDFRWNASNVQAASTFLIRVSGARC